LRRKARRYQFGAYIKGTGTRLRGLVSVAEIPWCRVSKASGEPATLLTVLFADRPSLEVRFPVRASNGAEKSCRGKRRRKRGLRKGKRRSRECHSRRTVSDRQALPKPPNLRKVLHRRRPEAWLVKSVELFHRQCSVYSRFYGPCPVCMKSSTNVGNAKCKRCAHKKKMRQYLLAKWTRLHNRSRELGFPDSVAFDSSFGRYLRREFQEDGLVYERSILRGTFPFRWIDPIGVSGEELILPSRPETVIKKKTLVTKSRRRREDGTPSIKCPYCGNVVYQTRPVCQRRSCGRVCREFFS